MFILQCAGVGMVWFIFAVGGLWGKKEEGDLSRGMALGALLIRARAHWMRRVYVTVRRE